MSLVVPGSAGFAATNGAWSVQPTTTPGEQPRPFFEPLMAANSTYPDSVTVSNETSKPLTFNLYPADGLNTAGGGFSLRPRTEIQHGVGTWIHLAASQITVPALTAANIPFVIDAPADATPGYHVGGIVAESTTPSTLNKGSVHVGVLQAVGTRVYVRIIGRLLPGFSITSMSINTKGSSTSPFGGSVTPTVSFTVQNTGNVPLAAHATVSLSPLFGSGPKPVHIAIPQILPGSSSLFTVPFPSLTAYAYLSATTVLTAHGIGPVTASTSTIIFPWALFLILLLVVAALIYAIIRRRRRASTTTSAE